MTTGILELAVVFAIAAALGIVAKLLRQPIILAYLATGIVIASLGFLHIAERETFQVFSDLGIMFLLFLVGLEINYTSLRLVGRPALILGLGQILFTFTLGYWIAWLLGIPGREAAYIAIALTFSSTVIVVKLLSEKRDLSSLYGKLSLGMLLVQDFVAMLLLVALTGLNAHDSFSWPRLLLTTAQGVALFLLMIWLGRKIMPSLLDRVARSRELLFLISLTWVFLVGAAVSRLGFSIEIAGLLAGVALANSSEHFEIAGRIRPLRDFFILVFFAILGTSLVLSDFSGLTTPIVVFSLFVLVGNPLVVLILLGFMGYRKRTSFLTGVTIAQISEFSLVLAALGFKLGHIPQSTVSLITAVGIITITVSTYLIIHAEKLFRRFTGLLSFFERRRPSEVGFPVEGWKKPIVLIGAHRTGESIARALPKKELLVIDFNPEVTSWLRRHGFDYLFGDIGDPEIFEKANVRGARLVISTDPDLEDNLWLLRELRESPRRPRLVVRAEDEADARLLYEAGADYVLLPHFTAGQYLGKTITLDADGSILDQLRKRDLEMLQKADLV